MEDRVANRYTLSHGKPLRGGLSVVRKAFDLEKEEVVAIKLIRGIPGDDEMARVFFERESVTLKSLRHSNIVRFIDAGWDDGLDSYYIALEWLPTSLKQVLSQRTAWPWEDFVTKIALPLADALEYAHLKKVENRDIKPANILMTDAGEPKLADFGIAKIHEQMRSFGETVGPFGSKPYMPPEQSEPAPFLRDTYAFAVLLVRSLSHPVHTREEVIKALREIEVPPELRGLLEKCLDPDPAKRPPNGAVLHQELADIVRGRKSQQEARSSTVWLQLTRSARQSLINIASATNDDRTPERFAESDLNQDVYVEYRRDPQNSELDVDTVFVIGRSIRYVLKQADETSFKVTSAQVKDDEWLERARAKSCSLGRSVTWTFRRPQDITQAEAGMATLIAKLEEHVDEQEKIREEARLASEKNILFDQWLRSLDAREDLDRGDDRPVDYKGFSKQNRNYQFTLTSPLDREVLGSEWEVVVSEFRRAIARGEVVAQGDHSLTLRISRGSKSIPKRGRIAPYLGPSQAALQRQREAVLNTKNGSAARPELRDMILDPSLIPEPTRIDLRDWNPNHLDHSKQEAVRYALGAEGILLIQGPPGTGKTSVITEIIEQFLLKHPTRRVLLVSQTHVAVDNALERLEQTGMKGLVRLGKLDDPRIDKNVAHLMLEHQIDDWAREVRRRAEHHLAARARENDVETHHLQAALALEQLAAVLSDIEVVEERVDTAGDTTPSELATDLELDEDEIRTQDRLDALTERKEELLTQARERLGDDLTLRDELTAAEARAAVELLLGDAGASLKLLEILRLQGEWIERLTSDRELAGSFLQTAKVVAGTCLGFLGHKGVRDLDFDLCILDEASKATATEALVPLARARNWILVGDTSQLPPMDEDLLRAPNLLRDHEIDASVVETTLFDRLVQGTRHPVQHMLVEQYRMTRPIGDMISSCFYDGKLKSPVERTFTGYEHVGKPVLWLDTGLLGGRRREDLSLGISTSAANRTEAQLVVERLKLLDKAVDFGLLKIEEIQQLEVLVIAPYRRQLEEIDRRIASLKTNHLRVMLQSVDAVQGREADIAIFSVTRSNSKGRMGFLAEPYWRRINVALSRARYGLTIIGDADFCRSAPGALRDVLDYMETHPDDCEIRKIDDAR